MADELETQDTGAGGEADDAAAAAAALNTTTKPTDAPAVDAKALADEVKALRGQLSEKDEAVRYWHEQARGTSRQPAKPAEEAVDDTDLLDLIGSKGTKGLTEHLRKAGFVSGKEVERMVESRATQLVRGQSLVAEYPDLSNDESPFFKATQKEYGRLINAGAPVELAMEQAARNVELRELKAGRTTRPSDADTEAERQRRIRAQGGDRGSRAASQPKEDEELTDFQKRIADSMGVSHEAYKKRAKAGVQYAGKH